MDLIVDALKDLTQRRMKQAGDGPLPSQQEVRDWFYHISPGFRTDNIFNDIFPSVYGIIYCEIMIERDKKFKINH